LIIKAGTWLYLEKKMKRITVGIVMILVAEVCFGQQRLVIPPFENRDSRIDTVQMENLTDLLINSIQRTNRFEVPDRDALALLMKEHNFQMSDWSDQNKSVQMGKVINANYIVRGIVSRIDIGVYLLIARLLDVNTAQILDSAELEFTTVRDARPKMDAFARDCLDNIRTQRETVQQEQRAQEQQQQQAAENERREAEQVYQAQRSAEQANRDAEYKAIAWKNKRWYLGGFIGGGMSDYSSDYFEDYYRYFLDEEIVGLFAVGAQAQLQVAKYFAIEADVAYYATAWSWYLPILLPIFAEFTLQPGPVEVNVGVGYEVVKGGLSFEASVGMHLGPGIIFFEFMEITGIGQYPYGLFYREPKSIFLLGYKFGLGNRK
jgi:curli biogenesis system outer membrane secretion channel CsgG